MATTAPELALGRARLGGVPLGGFSPAEIVPVVDISGLPGLVANDRYQMLVVADAGGDGAIPVWRYWLAQAPEWGAVLASGQRTNLVGFYALDEMDAPTPGDVETPYVDVPKGQAASVTHALVEFVPRPATLGDFDGGLDPGFVMGFEVWVESYGIVDFQGAGSAVPRVTGVHAVQAGTCEITSEMIDATQWPDTFTQVFYLREMMEVRSARVSIRNLHLCEITAIELYGNPQENRHG